ncbi:MAG: type IV secretion protein IcmD [Coxiellaceae bacterium]|nr:type IV secretion protein IcmD [Coxiellaceae bacterium]
MQKWKTVTILCAGLLLLTLCVDASASTTGYVSLTKIQQNVAKTVTETAKILQAMSLMAGIGFILSSFFKFHQHKLNPTQVPMSQGISLLIIGACLTMFPILIPTAGSTILGSDVNISSVSGTAISKLIGDQT